MSTENDKFNEVRLIIAGGRDFSNYKMLSEYTDHFINTVIQASIETGYFKTNKIIIVSGHARGADALGERYAKERGYELKTFPADWNKYGKSAGYIRNKQMSKYGNSLIAFWDGKSKGTSHMIDLILAENLLSIVYGYGDEV